MRFDPVCDLFDYQEMRGGCPNAVGEYVEVDEPFADQRGGERQVLLPPGDEFGDYAIMAVKA